MGVFNHKYPYTDFHELNLDWILETINNINDSIDDLDEWRANVNAEITALQNGQKSLEDAMDALEMLMEQFRTDIRAELTTLSDNLTAQTNKALADLTSYVDKSLATMQDQIDDSIDDLTSQVSDAIAASNQAIKDNAAKTETAIKEISDTLAKAIADLDAQSQAQYNKLLALITDYQSNTEALIDYKMDAFKAEISDILIDKVIVTDPVYGKIVNIQDALNHMYYAMRALAFTAAEFDGAGLTAAQFDAIGMTALDFDIIGKLIAPSQYSLMMMRDPFTGAYNKISNVVSFLVSLHQAGITASNFDKLGLTAQEFDDKALTAYQFDFSSDVLLTA